MERKPLGYAEGEVDPTYPEKTAQVVEVLVGAPFTRNRVFHNDAGNSVVVAERRQVVVAVLQDQNGIFSFEAFDPQQHGELVDIPQIGLNDFIEVEANADPAFLQALTNVRKRGASRPVEGEGGYIDQQIIERGGDESHKLPKTVYTQGKLA